MATFTMTTPTASTSLSGATATTLTHPPSSPSVSAPSTKAVTLITETRSASSGDRAMAHLWACTAPARILGAFLPRETALQDPRIDRLWHAADHIVLDDPRIAAIEAWLKLG